MLEELERSFSIFGTSWGKVEKKLIAVGMEDYTKIIPDYNYDKECYRGKCVLHWVFFAMASLILKDVKNVLEIGTGAGASTTVLAKLFPESTVYTIDMPESDPEYKKGWRGRHGGIHLPIFKKNIDRSNIKFVESNSFFLPTLDLPKKFEFIFVDGNHVYPVVASDIMFSYHSLADGGFLFMHDYELVPRTTENDVSNVVNWVSWQIKEQVFFFPQQQHMDKMACLVKGRFLKCSP